MGLVYKVLGIAPHLVMLIAVLWMSSKTMASRIIDQTSVEDEGIENDTRSRYALKKALAHNMLRYPDLYTFFAKANRKVMTPTVLDDGNILFNGISSDDSTDSEQTGISSLMMPPARRSPYKTTILCNRCESEYTPLRFGPDRFPRAVFQATCGGNGCPGLYVCRPLTFAMPVLKRRNGEPENANIPRSLQSEWTMETYDVPVACLCQHPDN